MLPRPIHGQHGKAIMTHYIAQGQKHFLFSKKGLSTMHILQDDWRQVPEGRDCAEEGRQPDFGPAVQQGPGLHHD